MVFVFFAPTRLAVSRAVHPVSPLPSGIAWDTRWSGIASLLHPRRPVALMVRCPRTEARVGVEVHRVGRLPLGTTQGYAGLQE